MATRTVPPYANGKIPASKLLPIPGGKLWAPAANAYNDLVEHVRRRHGATEASTLRAGGSDSSYRVYSRQVYWKNYWTRLGQPQKAATPGTSNHGLGIAIDVPNAKGKYYLRKYGHIFGWSNYEGARIGEDWHWTYVGPKGYKRKLVALKEPKGLTSREKYHSRRLMKERRSAERNGGWSKIAASHQKRADTSKAFLRKRANEIAMKDTNKANRAARINYLRAVAFKRY